MNDAPNLSETFVLRRLADPLPFGARLEAGTLGAVAAAVALVGFALTVWRFRATRRKIGATAATLAAGLRFAAAGLVAFAVAAPRASVEDVGNVAWLALTGAGLLLAIAAVGAMYAADRRAIGWRAVPLALLRSCVFALLAWAFLLPAVQTWERTEKHSKVVVLIDVSPSIGQVSDDPSTAGKLAPTRLDQVLDALAGDGGLLPQLAATNPVTVYRFGAKLDDESQRADADADSPGWTPAEWKQFCAYDFKSWLLRNVSGAGRELVAAGETWKPGQPGDAEWATAWANLPTADAVPAALTPDDALALTDAKSRLERRVDVARSVLAGTALPDSLAAAISREAGNLVQALIVFSDGRGTLGGEAGSRTVRELAEREKIPVFAVAVGDPREAVRVALADLQAPESVPPNEEFKVVAEAEGVGLADAKLPVTLELFLPGRDAKSGKPDLELPSQELLFRGDTQPPRGQVEFGVDPANLPEALTEPVPEGTPGALRRRLKQGAWQVVARAPRDKRELAGGGDHRSPPRTIQVIDRPTRILLFAGGPSREYQTLRTLLVRETSAKRAELTIYLQTPSGRAGTAVQDVPQERMLTRFPSRYDTRNVPPKAGERFDNLNEYDLVVAFDPDWSELSADNLKDLETWVDNGGGGLLYVAGPLYTFQLARADEGGRLKPLLDLLPVVPDDIILVKTRPVPRSPRRLLLKPSAEYDLLRLADEPPADPVAGWEKFFTGSDALAAGTPRAELVNPKRGFFGYYPLKGTKPGAATLAELLEPAEGGGEPTAQPWLVTAQPSAGRAVFLASGETWRLRGFNKDYFDRFWVKLTRYAAGGRKAGGSPRGRVLVAREAVAGSQVRVQVKLLAANGKPYAPQAMSPKFRVEVADSAGEKKGEFGPYELQPRISSAGFDGYYAGQVLADPAKFPPGDARFKVVVDVPDSPGDTLSGEFRIKRSDPELDDTRPDLPALEAIAGGIDEVRARVKDPAVLEALAGQTDPAKAKLVFRLGDRAKLSLIPACVDSAVAASSNRGPVRDLWDGPVSLAPIGLPVELVAFEAGGTRVEVGWLLALAVLLLGVEWLARKFLRLA